MKCPFKFSNYEFEGGEDCIGTECGMHKLCGANDTFAAENDVSAARVDANDVNAMQDSREKLEADVRWQMGHFFAWDEKREEFVGYVLEWLDRQAAITERECRSEFDALDEHAQALERENEELRKQVDELRADLNTADWNNKYLNKQVNELAAELGRDTLKACNTCAARIDLEQQVEELTSELTAARNAHAQAEHEAVILREKLGRMLDCSHEITRIGGDC